MNSIRSILAVATASIGLLGVSSVAGAFTVTSNSSAPSSWAAAMAATPNTLNLPGVWAVTPSTRTGNSSGFYRSPFDNEGVGGDNSAYIGNQYWAVGPDNPNNPAIMTFSIDQSSLSFLWGSVDNYNAIELYNNGSLVATILNSHITGPTNTAGLGASFVTIGDVLFDELRFGSGQNAFEFSNITSTPVPLPAAAWLLISGLAGLGVVSRRRKA